MMKETQNSMAEMPGSMPDGSGRNLQEEGGGVSNTSAREENSDQRKQMLMEALVESGNMNRAMMKVVSNKGSSGPDEMTVQELKEWLRNKHTHFCI